MQFGSDRCHATEVVGIFSFRVFLHFFFIYYSDIGTVPPLNVQYQSDTEASEETEENEGALKRSTVKKKADEECDEFHIFGNIIS